MGKIYFLGVFLSLLLFSLSVSAEEVLIGYWKFDEGNGNMTDDSSGNGLGGDLENGVAWTSDSISGFALDFDGIDDSVFVGDDSILDTSTQVRIVAWVKRQGLSEYTIVGRNGPYYLSIENNFVKSGVYTSGGGPFTWKSVSGTTILQLNQWYKLEMAYDGSQLKVYVNDILDGSFSTTGFINSNGNNLIIGYGDPGFPGYFIGIIDEVKIYGDAFPTPEICDDNLDNDLDGKTDCYDLDDCGGFCINELQQDVSALQAENAQLQQQIDTHTSLITSLQNAMNELKDKVRMLWCKVVGCP